MPCLLCYEMSSKFEALWLSCVRIWGVCIMSVFSVFSVIAGRIAKMLFMLFFASIAV